MGATARFAFAIAVVALVLASLMVTLFGQQPVAQATAPAARTTLVIVHETRPAVVPAKAVQAAAQEEPVTQTPVPQVTVTVTVTPTPAPTVAPTRVGYVSQRGLYGGTNTIKELDASGRADRLSYVNYGFANIDPENLTCLNGVTKQPSPDSRDPNQGDGAADAWADYQRPFADRESVDGVGDPAEGPLAGNFNQLKKLKAKHPRLQTLISIGGWTYSKYFSDVAKSEDRRRRFVDSCLDLYIRGDLPQLGGRGGPGAAEGVFDGIDIDWEWPGAHAHPGNHTSVADKENLTALLAEFRKQLDALGVEKGRHFLLTAYVPFQRDLLDAGWDLGALFQYIDFPNVQQPGVHAAAETGSPF